jgi:hypothetical protein
MDREGNPGMSMKHISRFMGSGVISIGLLMGTAIWRASRLSEKRDMDAAQQFFRQALAVVGSTPESVTTDGHRSYPRAIRETLGNEVVHRTNVYLNNRIEQDHRGIKQRYSPMRSFGTFLSATRFCRAIDEVRQYFRLSHPAKGTISLAQQRRSFREGIVNLGTWLNHLLK